MDRVMQETFRLLVSRINASGSKQRAAAVGLKIQRVVRQLRAVIFFIAKHRHFPAMPETGK